VRARSEGQARRRSPQRAQSAFWPGLFVFITLAIGLFAIIAGARETTDRAQDAPRSTPTPVVTPRSGHIGIIAGHWGNDAGAVCEDGLTEASVNLDIARRVEDRLRQSGYQVDLLEEFDDRLTGYRADVLLSIHADSCEYVNDEATGFKVASAAQRSGLAEDTRLVDCLTRRYARRTGLPFHAGSITYDMTGYHGFREIAPDTPAAIIETGFLYLDRDVLTGDADTIAEGIVEGLRCFLEDETP
jgi:N-acetylmuramoyl-L-alanine amidase